MKKNGIHIKIENEFIVMEDYLHVVIRGEYDVAKVSLELGGSDMDDAQMSVFLSETLSDYFRKVALKLHLHSTYVHDIEEKEKVNDRINKLMTSIKKLNSRIYKENVIKEYKCIVTVMKRKQNSIDNKV